MYAVNISAKFELRNFTRSWDNRGYCKNLGSLWVRPRTLFSQIFNGLLFAWTLWIYLPNLKLVASRVPEIIRGTEKFGPSLDTPTLPILLNFYRTFVCMDAVNILAKFEVRSFRRSWNNRGILKKIGKSLDTPTLLFSQIFNGLLLGCTVWIYLPNLKFVALRVPEIIGGTGQITLWRHHWRHVTWISYPCGWFIRTMH